MDIQVKAHAKINWTLEVLGSFPEEHSQQGFTELVTAMFLIDSHDLLTVRVLDSADRQLTICCSNKDVPQTKNGNAKSNVCYKAIAALRKAVKDLPQNDLVIEIDKQIPLAGGLGGSSTDGSATLKALNELWELGLSDQELVKIASEFGSDTCFFASAYTGAVATGRGEIIKPLPALSTPVHLVFINPGIELMAGSVYGSLKATGFKNCRQKIDNVHPTDLLIEGLKQGVGLKQLSRSMYNDLVRSPLVRERMPDLFDMLDSLLNAGCPGAGMSGSGSTVFGVVENREVANRAESELRQRYPNYSVFSDTVSGG